MFLSFINFPNTFPFFIIFHHLLLVTGQDKQNHFSRLPDEKKYKLSTKVFVILCASQQNIFDPFDSHACALVSQKASSQLESLGVCYCCIKVMILNFRYVSVFEERYVWWCKCVASILIRVFEMKNCIKSKV